MTVGVLNSWGELRRWGTHLVHHAIWYKQIYSYTGVMEALSGFPFHVRFISFDDIRKDPDTLNDVDVLINVGSAYTSFSGEKSLTKRLFPLCVDMSIKAEDSLV